jgi:hypothetical protein
MPQKASATTTSPCKNVPETAALRRSARYTGSEPSPKGLGFCARFEKDGARRKGKDGVWWIATRFTQGRAKLMFGIPVGTVRWVRQRV